MVGRRRRGRAKAGEHSDTGLASAVPVARRVKAISSRQPEPPTPTREPAGFEERFSEAEAEHLEEAHGEPPWRGTPMAHEEFDETEDGEFIDPDFPDFPPDEVFADGPMAEHQAEAAPFPTHCFDVTVHRSMDITIDGARTTVAAATATTPPQEALGPATRFRTIAGLDSNFATELTATANATEFLATTRGRMLLDTGHFRVDPTDASRFEVRLRGVLCHPARTAGSTSLPTGSERLPVAIIVHGNHTAVDFDVADSGGARTTETVITSAGPVSITKIPARASVRHEVESFRGYRYLQEHLAAAGIVSMSIDTNAANETNSLIRFRADLVLEALDHLRSLNADRSSPFHDRLDLTKVALVGHSRGGDAVAMASDLNRQRGAATRYGVRAVVAVAPTDFTGMLAAADRLRMRSTRTASFLCVYGSHDGDVSGRFSAAALGQGWGFVGTGFRHYDRASTQRAMVFVHGATHNRFNSIWVDPAAHSPGSPAQLLARSKADNFADAPTVDPTLPASSSFPTPASRRDARVLSEADHQTLAREYVGGWLALWLLGKFSEQQRFIGAAPNSLGTPIGLQWKLGRTIRGVDNFDDADPGRNQLGGTTVRPSFVQERLIELSDLAHSPHHDRVLQAGAPTGSSPRYISRIPSGKRNWTNFSALTFRVSKHFVDVSTPAAIAAASFPPTLRVTLFDGRNRKTLDQAAIAPLNPRTVRPYHRELSGTNLTKVHMQTWQIPLLQFAGTGGISLSSVRAIEIEFGASTGEPHHIDTLSLIRI